VERSPSPVALEDRDADELTLEEARELVRRMRTREQHPIDLGGERGEAEAEDEEEGDVSITDIITPDMKRARIASSAEVIDLTDE
jgi:hypothetical protein